MSTFSSPTILIEKYSKKYKENPGSRVFAPLAEAYRKEGDYDEAIDILKRGVKDHPDYVYGYICLAQCYFDLNQLNVAFSLLNPLIEDHGDNYKLLKLFGEISQRLGKSEEALNCFKLMLFYNPKDEETASKVKVLEEKLTPDFSEVKNDEELFNTEALEEESWTEVPLNSFEEVERFDEEPVLEAQEEIELKETQENTDDSKPVVTHTLVDLYLKQGHKEKALEIVDKLLESNPDDEKTLEKREEILDLMGVQIEDSKENSLMDLYDSKVAVKDKVKVEKLEKFLSNIQEKAQSRSSL